MDSILSVRINEEVKEKFIKLAEEQGVNNKEFLDLIIKNYEITKVSTEVDFVKNDIEELQSIIKRILDIYINVIDKNKLKTTELINNFNSSISEEKNKNDSFSVEINEMKKQLNELKNENKEIKNSNKEFQVLLAKEKDALNESREMNSILKDKLKDFNLYKEENENLKKRVEEAENSLNEFKEQFYDLQQNYEKCNRDREELKLKVTEITKSNGDVVEKLKASYENQLVLRENELSLKMRQEFLQKEQNLREEFWELKSNYDEKISSLMKEKEELLFKLTTKIDK